MMRNIEHFSGFTSLQEVFDYSRMKIKGIKTLLNYYQMKINNTPKYYLIIKLSLKMIKFTQVFLRFNRLKKPHKYILFPRLNID